MNQIKSVVVVGGGLAGLAAATRLAQEGWRITLIEKRAVLGGRASSVLDPESGRWVDNCQHVLLGCCSTLLTFYQRLGVQERITFYDKYVFMDKKGKISCLESSRLPFPFHLLPSFLGLKFLSVRDKIRILGALTLMALTPESKMHTLDRIPFSQWLTRHLQTPQAIQRFWHVILVSALNEELENISTKYAFKTFKEIFFKKRGYYRMAIPNTPLSLLYSEPAASFLEKRGGQILYQKRVEHLEIRNGKAAALLLNDGSRREADHFILALPFHDLLEILPKEYLQENPYFKKIQSLETSPITGIHLFFDRPITELDHAILLDRKIQWLFNKTKNSPSGQESGQYIQLVVSASRDLIGRAKKDIVDMALQELTDLFPEVRAAKLMRSIVIKELKATFSPRTGHDLMRPSQKSPIQNLLIAGDWTRTDWPATMESAVRSGEQAAEELIKTTSARLT